MHYCIDMIVRKEFLIIHHIIIQGFPYGHAKGPGLESECKNLEETKYCHNYYSIYFDVPDRVNPDSNNINQNYINSILLI